ncbi:hypothetical protein RBIBE_19020 [Bacillus velezensis]|nr:hypothetical protein AVM03_04030 [Bacillus amyloliquefaciens]AVX17169.1 hypothetical protein C5I45_09890 [Bacillus sp. ZY-1-1]BET17912.1 hypothetical protein RBIBE_19020 [Bacillus velezensis]
MNRVKMPVFNYPFFVQQMTSFTTTTLLFVLQLTPLTLSTFIHKVIFFTGHLVAAPGKCEFTTLIKFKHKKVEFPVL